MRDVLVEHIIKHSLRISIERIAPSATPAVVITNSLSGSQRKPVSSVRDHDLIGVAVSKHQLVGLSAQSTCDPRHGVLHADHIGVDASVNSNLFDVMTSAETSPLASATGVRSVIAGPLNMRVQAFIDLGCGFPEVAKGCSLATPGVHPIRSVAPAGVHLG